MKKLPADCMAVYEAMCEVGHPVTSRELAEILPGIHVPGKLKTLRCCGMVRKVGRSGKNGHASIWDVM